jgi:hypothetical protein
MPVLVGRIRGDASRASEIVIHSVGSDGMETNRDFLSVVEAERLILSVRRAISSSRPETVKVRSPAGTEVAALQWQGGSTMIDIDEPHPNLVCGICDDNDHCVPRWEDDGGEIDRPPSLARAFEFEEDSERDHGHLDQPSNGRRHRPI